MSLKTNLYFDIEGALFPEIYSSFSDLLMFAEHFRGLDELYCHGTECIFPYQILLLNSMIKTQCLNLRRVLTSLIIRLL